MYRRNISHILRLLGLLLAGLFLYQLWIKPSYLAQGPSQSGVSSVTPSAPNAPMGQPEQITHPDVPQTRLIDPGEAPSRELSLICDDLERGNYSAVESSLQKYPAKKLATGRAKQYVAALWNNLGIQQEKYGGIEVSVRAFKKAVALDPGNPTALLNLTQAYWGLRDNALTPEFLQTVIQSAPKDPFPHLALADILIEHGNRGEAVRHLRLVEESTKTDSNLHPYFLQLSAKLDRSIPSDNAPPDIVATAPSKAPQEPVPAVITHSSPAPLQPVTQAASQKTVMPTSSSESGRATPVRAFQPRSQEHFTIQFDGKEYPDQSTQIRSILEYAYQEMSQKFGHVPAGSIRVVLHATQKFATHAGTPAWADSLYEPAATTIHIPMDGALEDLGLLSRVVRHEFAHALLQEKDGMQPTPLPTWLVEGLAIHLAEDPWPDLEEPENKSFTVMPLTTLQPAWAQLPTESRTMAYLESLVAAQTLIDQYSMYSVRQMMSAIRAGQSLEDAMQHKLAVSYSQFHQAWEKQYQSLVRAGHS